MKMNKKQAGLIAGLVCVVLLLLLLLSMCGREEEVTPTEPAPSTEVVETTEETTVPTEETAEATEEATEATEETTEPTEEATEPTTGNTSPGGTGGYDPGLGGGGNDDTNTPVTEEAPAPGSEESPYLEIVTQFPDTFQTVSIPTNTTVYQTILGAENALLTIEDVDAYVIYNGETYESGDDGIVTVALAAPETEGAPVVLQVGNKNEEGKAFALNFQASLGSQHNPEPITDQEGVISIEKSLEAGNTEGYFYQYTAKEPSKLTLAMDVLTEDALCDMVVTVNETAVKLSESEDGIISVDLKQDEVALIQVIAAAGEDGTIPAVDLLISGMVESAPGTSANPIVVMGEFPIVTDPIEPGASLFYSIYGANDMTLKVEDAAACITVDGTTFAPVDGVISTVITAENPRMPVTIVVGNSGEEAKSFTLELIPPLGTQSNPEPMAEGENTAVLEAGDIDGYWFRWTAESDALVTITMSEGSWVYAVNHTSGEEVSYGDSHWSDDDPVVSSTELKVAYGDVVDVMVNTYDPADMFGSPAGEVTFRLDVVQYLDVTHAGADPELKPGETIYCKAMIRSKSIILKVAGEGDFTVHMEGRDYTPVNGVVTIEGIETDFYDPKQFTITNQSDAAVTYSIRYENPVGSSENPAKIEEMGEYTCQVIGDGEGYFFTWTATADGTLTVTMTCDDWSYTINNLTSYQYGMNRVSTSEDPSEEVLTVKAGDNIQINLGTASREQKDVTFTVAFQIAEPPAEDDSTENTEAGTGEDNTTGESTEGGADTGNTSEDPAGTEAGNADNTETENTSDESSSGESSQPAETEESVTTEGSGNTVNDPAETTNGVSETIEEPAANTEVETA